MTKYEVILSPHALDDLNYWKKTSNSAVLKRIRQLIQSIQEDPYKGLGKPEPLKHDLSGMWSRRINREHRLVYEIESNVIAIQALKEHY